MILLPDVPGIRAQDIRSVMQAFAKAGGDTPTRATDKTGLPGTPLIAPARLVAEFAKLTGDAGGKTVLAGETVELVPLDGDRATRDLDTPEDWDRWRSEQAIHHGRG